MILFKREKIISIKDNDVLGLDGRPIATVKQGDSRDKGILAAAYMIFAMS